MKFFSIIVLGLFLVGCDISSPLELVYFKRDKFSFEDKEHTTKTIFMCVKDSDDVKTQQRATAANDYYTTEFDKITEEFTKNVIADSEGDKSIASDIVEKMTKDTEKLIFTIEKDFQCMLIDIIDLEEEKD